MLVLILADMCDGLDFDYKSVAVESKNIAPNIASLSGVGVRITQSITIGNGDRTEMKNSAFKLLLSAISVMILTACDNSIAEIFAVGANASVSEERQFGDAADAAYKENIDISAVIKTSGSTTGASPMLNNYRLTQPPWKTQSGNTHLETIFDVPANTSTENESAIAVEYLCLTNPWHPKC